MKDEAPAAAPRASPPRAPSDGAALARATRSKIAVLLGEAARDPSPLFDLGRAVEAALFAAHGADAASPEYRAASRVLAANLKRNAPLRARVLSGDLPPASLCAMTPDELATEDLRSTRAAMEERATRKRTWAHMDAATATSKYTCRECGGSECAYINVSGHRDIGKNETWGSKDSQADDGRVLVTCRTCDAEWRQSVLG